MLGLVNSDMARVSRAISSVYDLSMINKFIFGQVVVIYFIMQSLLEINSENTYRFVAIRSDSPSCFDVYPVSCLIILLHRPNYHGIYRCR